jgi:ketosteroid isomerase-like protein
MSAPPSTRVVARRVFAALRAHDLDRFRTLLDPDATLTNPLSGTVLRGTEAIIDRIEPLLAAFPDLTPTVKTLIVDDDRAAAEVIRTGTHTEPLVLSGETIPPTGEEVELPECVLLRVEDESVVALTAYTDRRALREQLGLS